MQSSMINTVKRICRKVAVD